MMLNKLSIVLVVTFIVIFVPIYHVDATPTIVMSDTNVSFGALVSAPRQFVGELATSTSVLVGKPIDSITLKLQKVGAPTGIAQVGIFDINRNVVKSFGTIDVSTISTTATDYEFKLLSTDSPYTIQSSDRIGFMYTGGSTTVGVNITPDRSTTGSFDGVNSHRIRYETAWIELPTEDMYMILKQTNNATSVPGISINDISLTEGNAGTKNFNFTVTRAGNTTGTSSVNYTTSDGTATISNSDYVAKSGMLVFTPGQTTKTITILVNGNTVVEPTETFNVNLSSCIGCTITDNLGVGTIQNDDSPSVPTIVMSDTTASFASLISAPRQFIGELATPTSVLVGKPIDSITIKLQKVGAPTGIAQVGVFDINRNVVRLFGTIDVSTISTTATDYEFKLLSTDPLYTIASGDRIGIKYTGGSATVGVNVTPDRDAADPFDGANSYRVRYETAWITATTEDMYMILKQTGSTTSTPFILLNPSTGIVGSTVNISGNNFAPSSTISIKFNGVIQTANPVTITSNSSGGFTGSITVPSSSTGPFPISATDASSTTASSQFTVNSSGGTSISLFPSSANNGDVVKITGTNFSPSTTITSVKFDTLVMTNSPSTTNTVTPRTIHTDSAGSFVATFQVPASPVGQHTVTVTDLGHSVSKSITIAPTSLLLNPISGHVGATVNIHPSGFASNSVLKVTFDSNQVVTTPSTLTTTVNGEAQGSFTVPAAASLGPHPIAISDANGNIFSSSFNVLSSNTPVFSVQNIVTGLTSPDNFAFIPDNGPGVDGSGAFMVLQKNGVVFVVKNNGGIFVKQTVPFVTAPSSQGFGEDAGLLGIAFDNNWVTTKMVYFYYTTGNPAIQNQVVRYFATTDSSGNIVANSTSQMILGGIPAKSNHNGGHLKFDSQGNLYISTGDNFQFTPGQDLTTLAGKLLRITPLVKPDSSGKLYSIPSSNPFASNPSSTVRKEIYSYGLRNPYTFDIDSVTGKIYGSNVGWNTWETVFNSTNPSNFGWPNYEGPVIGNPDNLASFVEPIFWYPHAGIEPITGNAAGLEAIEGSAFYNGNTYPSQLQGAYFFGDYAIGQIQALLSADKSTPQIDPASGVAKSQVQTIISGLNLAPIDMHVWNGKLYYVDLTGKIAVLNYS